LLKWELTGIGVIFLLGSAFHFIFDLAGSRPALGVFFAVNESVFEHLKLTFWPVVLWAAFSYKFVKSSTGNFFIAKAAGFFAMPLTIVILFYGYTTLTGLESVIIDILIFLVAVACGQLVSLVLLKATLLPLWLSGLSALLIIILGALYGVFTFYPPHVSFFMDSNSGGYGIP
jgi:hypothetical protein